MKNQKHSEISPQTNHQGNEESKPQRYRKKETTGVGEDVEKSEPFCTAGGNISWCCCEKQYGFLKKLKIELPYDPGIPLWGMYSMETISVNQRDTRPLMFIIALLTTAEIRKQQPRCLWIDKWIKKMCVCMYIYTTHTHNGILFRYIKRKSCHL